MNLGRKSAERLFKTPLVSSHDEAVIRCRTVLVLVCTPGGTALSARGALASLAMVLFIASVALLDGSIAAASKEEVPRIRMLVALMASTMTLLS